MSVGLLLIAAIGIIMILLLCVIVWAVVARRKNVGSGEEKDQKMAIAAAAAVGYLAGYKVTPILVHIMYILMIVLTFIYSTGITIRFAEWIWGV
jgi:hypothetical protein